MNPDTPSSAASGMGEYELASASVRPEPSSVESMAPLVAELRALADCDSRAGEPLGKCMRRAADKIERLAEHVDYIEAQWLAKAAALSAKDRELAEAQRPEVRCDGCGSSWTEADLARERAANPNLLSCCPERKPLTIDQWKARADEALSALRPFVEEFEARRESYIRRYPRNPGVGAANFDAMPDDWKMENSTFTMGQYRRARSVLTPVSREQRGEEA